MEQEILLEQPLEKQTTIYDRYQTYQKNSPYPWAPHKNGLYDFILRLCHSSIKYIKDSPLEETYSCWYPILTDLERIYNEVPRKMKEKIYKIIELLEPYDNFMTFIHMDSKVKHHHIGGNTMRHRKKILQQRNRELDKLNQELFTLQNPSSEQFHLQPIV